MRIELHHFHHVPPEAPHVPPPPISRDDIREVFTRLGDVEEMLRQVLSNQQRQENSMTQEVQDMKAAIEDQTSVISGVGTLVHSTVDLLDELVAKINAAADAGDLAEVKTLTAEVQTHTQALRDSATALGEAVVSHTPAATPSPDAPQNQVPPVVTPEPAPAAVPPDITEAPPVAG